MIACVLSGPLLVESNDSNSYGSLSNAFNVASGYAKSISCDPNLDLKKMVVMRTTADGLDKNQLRYALIWGGDIGCMGGSGSWGWHISIVGHGAGNTVIVLPELSSPAIKFYLPCRFSVRQVVKVNDHEIKLYGEDYMPYDGCWPEAYSSIRMIQDSRGNWNLVEKKRE